MPDITEIPFIVLGFGIAYHIYCMFTTDPEEFGLAFWRTLQWCAVLFALDYFIGG